MGLLDPSTSTPSRTEIGAQSGVRSDRLDSLDRAHSEVGAQMKLTSAWHEVVIVRAQSSCRIESGGSARANFQGGRGEDCVEGSKGTVTSPVWHPLPPSRRARNAPNSSPRCLLPCPRLTWSYVPA